MKKRTSENRTTENHISQGPAVLPFERLKSWNKWMVEQISWKQKVFFSAQGGEIGPLWIHLYIGQCVVVLGT